MTTIFIYIGLFLVSFFPIVIWAYIFSYIDDNPMNKNRFFMGLVGGAFSVLPILYLDKIVSFLHFKYLNIFYFVSQISTFFSSIELSFSLVLFFLLIAIFSFFIGMFVNKFSHIFWVYLRNMFVFIVCVVLLSFCLYLLHFFFAIFDFKVSDALVFGDLVFDSLKLVVFYYLIVSFIEESSKHFNFLQSSFVYIDSVKKGVLYAIFVALGFSLIENMLYLYNAYLQNGFTPDMFRLYFFRSIFSVIVHVLCSSVIAYYFSKALLLYREHDLSFPYLKIFLFGLLISILLHLIFNVALTLGFSFIVFIYFIGGYLYVSSIFYREEEKN